MRKFALLFLGFVVAVSACSGGSDEIGSVGDRVFTMADIDELYEVDTVPIDQSFRESLFRVMAVEALEQAVAADFGITIDQARIDELFEQRLGEVEAAGLTVADALGFPGAGDEMLRFNSKLEILLDDTITAFFADEEFLRRFYDEEGDVALTSVCARHILVNTAEEADAALARLEGGEDFGTVASEVSLDTGSLPEGSLGCAPAGNYVGPFADATIEAPLGELWGPVETQFGFHIIIVDDRTKPTFEEVAAAPETYVPAQAAQTEFGAWFNTKLEEADVTLDEQYGTWTPTGIVPPAGEE